MKTRHGFVSNSSSSSFIIGLGKVTDLELFSSWFENQKGKQKHCGSVRVVGTSDIREIPEWEIKRDWTKQTISLGCDYTSNEVSISIDPSKEEKFLVVEIHNNEGDYEQGYLTECVYEHTLFTSDYFSEDQQELLYLGKDQGLSEYNVTFGCGRNG